MEEHQEQKRKMTDEHKKKISNTNKGLNQGTIYITNGKIVKRIQPYKLNSYLEQGFHLGRKLDNQVWIPWNKGKKIKL